MDGEDGHGRGRAVVVVDGVEDGHEVRRQRQHAEDGQCRRRPGQVGPVLSEPGRGGVVKGETEWRHPGWNCPT